MKEIIKFLYPSLSEGYSSIQFIVADRKKKPLAWFPGKRDKKMKSWSWCQRKIDMGLTGFTGRTFPNFEYSKDRQPYDLHWLAIDYDNLLSGDDSDNRLFEKIKKITPCGSIRTSCGGRGFHLIFQLQKPVRFQSGYNCRIDSQAVLRSFVEELRDKLRIHPCKYGYGDFYLLGGLNRWIYQSPERIEFTQVPRDFLSVPKRKYSLETYHFLNFSETAREFFTELRKIGVCEDNEIPVKQGIWVKEVFEVLKYTKFAFSTKSPMKSGSWHENGFIEINNREIVIFTNADNKIVLRVPCF